MQSFIFLGVPIYEIANKGQNSLLSYFLVI